MADFELYFYKLLKKEGGYVDNKADKGGPTKYGITLATWIREGYDKNDDGVIDKEDVKLISVDDAKSIAKRKYWDTVRGDYINSQSIAEFLFDWAYTSGPSTAVRKLQKVIAVPVDGVAGALTITKLNKCYSRNVFELLKIEREKFFRNIVAKDPSQKKFLKGWLNRNNSFKFHD